jgi:hypothetical protein
VRAWATQLLSAAGGTGESLELLVSYTFMTLPHVQVQWRRTGRAGEIDVLVRNLNPIGLPLPWFGEFLMAECKDRKETVRLPQVEALVTKLALAGIKTGIIVSRAGVAARGQARTVLDHVFSRSEIVIVDLLISDFLALDSPEAFLALLQRGYEKVRFGGS